MNMNDTLRKTHLGAKSSHEQPEFTSDAHEQRRQLQSLPRYASERGINSFYEGYIPVVTIDGTSGAGKGEISRLLAAELTWHLLDSGAIYRALALLVIRKRIALDNIPLLVISGKELEVQFVTSSGASQKTILAGQDVTMAIRSAECGDLASKIAAIPEVRAVLIQHQRSLRRLPGLVADGRDMGTVVFPDALLKIFLTASVKERARRRLLQLQDQGINATLDTVLMDLEARDERDIKRVVSPLKPDPAAVIIDTTKFGINEVLQQILAHVKNM